MASSKKPPVSTIAIAAIALLIFVAAVAIGMSMLGKDKPVSGEDASDSTSSSASTSSSSDASPSSSSTSASDSTTSSSSTSASSTSTSTSTSTSGAASTSTSSTSASTSGSAVTSASASASASTPATTTSFNAKIYGDSGFSKIPNFKKINSDVKGWLKIPGTNMDYPVLYDSRDMGPPSYHYYLDKDINKQTSKDGVIYADPAVGFGTRSQISDNTVLYGHNWTNVSANPRIGSASDVMMAQMAAYHHLDFAKSHPYIYYSTEKEEMVWQVFATFYTDINFVYNYANPQTDAEFKYIIDGAKKRSRHNFDTAVSTTDKIITLSTCTRAYGQSDKQRFVVMAKLIPTPKEFKAVTVTTNPNPVLPKL